MKPSSTNDIVTTHWAGVSVIVGSGIAVALQFGKVAIAAPLLQNDFTITLAVIGWLSGIFALIGLVGGIPTGAFVARFGARRILILGLLLTAAGAALSAATLGLTSLFLGRVIEGAGFLLVTVAAPSLLEEVTRPADRDLAFALWSCFMPVGMATAMLVGPLFEAWRTLWWASGALALAICMGVSLIIPTGGKGPVMSWKGLRRDSMSVWRNRGAVGLGITFALYSLMFFAVFSFLPVLLMERLQVTHQMAGLLSALASVVNVIGNLAAGLLLTKGFSRSALLNAACFVMGMASFGIFLPVLPDSAAFGLCLLFSAVGGVIPAILLSSAPIVALAAGPAPIVLGLIVQGNNLGQIVGPTAIGGALDRFGWDSAAYIVASAALIAVFAVTLTLRRVGADQVMLGMGDR